MQTLVGQKAAENIDDLAKFVAGSDIVFITAMGGGTGTGAAPVIAKVQRCGILTVGVVTKPFTLKVKREHAELGISFLKVCGFFSCCSNDKLLHIAEKNTTMLEAF